MKVEKRSLSDIRENSINTRIHNPKQIQEFKKSILKFGAIRPIVIDENGVILAGHGQFIALKDLGWEEADVIVMNGLSEKDKKKLLLADNKIYSLGNDNYTAIESILRELGGESDFQIPGYDSDILEELYGIKSVEKEAEEAGIGRIEDGGNGYVGYDGEEGGEYAPQSPLAGSQADLEPVGGPDTHEPPERLREARQEAIEGRKFIICPNCGEKICL